MKEENAIIINSAIASVDSVSWNVSRAQIRVPTEATKVAAKDL